MARKAPDTAAADPFEPIPETPLTLEPEPVEAETEPLDIPEPTLPPGVVAAVTPTPAWSEHEVLLQGALQHLQGKLNTWLHDTGKDAMACVEDMHAYIKRQIDIDRDAVRHAESAMDALVANVVSSGITVRQDPYQLAIEAVSPQGFPVTLTIRKATADELISDLDSVVGWLADNGYRAVDPQVHI